MATTKKKKTLKILSRNSYIGRLKGVHYAFLPDRCAELSAEEITQISVVEKEIGKLLKSMKRT